MKVFKYIVIRILGGLLLLLLANEIYTVSFWKEDIEKHGDILNSLWNLKPNTDAIYFG